MRRRLSSWLAAVVVAVAAAASLWIAHDLRVRPVTAVKVAGPFEKGPERGHMSYANQVRGTAIIDARTGLPTSFECTEEVRTDVRQGAAQVQQRATATVRATVQRKD